MIKKASDMKAVINIGMRGGNGSVSVKEILLKGEYKGNAKMIADVTIEPHCSIGEHLHNDEEEIYYILSGTAEYNDNGRKEKLSAGDSCICLGGEKHGIENVSDSENLRLIAVILKY